MPPSSRQPAVEVEMTGARLPGVDAHLLAAAKRLEDLLGRVVALHRMIDEDRQVRAATERIGAADQSRDRVLAEGDLRQLGGRRRLAVGRLRGRHCRRNRGGRRLRELTRAQPPEIETTGRFGQLCGSAGVMGRASISAGGISLFRILSGPGRRKCGPLRRSDCRTGVRRISPTDAARQRVFLCSPPSGMGGRKEIG